MKLFAFLFILGSDIVHYFPTCPPISIPIALLIGALMLSYSRLGRCALALLLGFTWTLLHTQALLSVQLPAHLEGKTLRVVGVVERIMRVDFLKTTFVFQAQATKALPAMRMRLSWYGPQRYQLHAGARWSLPVRLKKPHGFANPGAYDSEKQLFAQRIRSVGYVYNKSPATQLTPALSGSLSALREKMGEHLSDVFAKMPYQGLLRALTIGDQSAISTEQWTILRATGTTHLMAISGLHIGLVAMLVYWLAAHLWCFSARLLAACPAQVAAAFFALGAAVIYSALAGFAIPTQRALLMLGLFMGALIARRVIFKSTTLALAGVMIILLDPFATFVSGFWLSLLAAGLIIGSLENRVIIGKLSYCAQWVRMQMVLFVGLWPLAWLFFHQISLLAPLMNMIAIPWMSWLVVPLALLGLMLCLVTPWADNLLYGAHAMLAGLWYCLQTGASWSGASHYLPGVTLYQTVVLFVSVVLLLLPRGLPGKAWAVAWLVIALNANTQRPPVGSVWFTLLDVGQGLSAVVRTAHHTLLYDTGKGIGKAWDTGSAVIVPFLRQQNISTLDTLVISHHDNDHRGGAGSVLSALPVRGILSGDSSKKDHWRVPVRRCVSGAHWRWDGVLFTVLHPGPHYRGKRNNMSCVIRIETGHNSLLLTGDIEATVEKRLLRQAQTVHADVLVAPHHGSATSSSAAFIKAVSPRFVMFATGYRNPFGFPNPQVVARYAQHKVRAYETAQCGAIALTLSPEAISDADCYRLSHPHFWSRAPKE